MGRSRYWIFFLSVVFLCRTTLAQSQDTFVLRKDEPIQKSGGVYFSSTKKNEVLFKGSIWGAVQYPGVHYMPLGTRFLEALSLAGGPNDAADTEEILLSSKAKDGVLIRKLSVVEAMKKETENPILQADDIVVVKEDQTQQRVSLYLQIGTFVISAAALGLMIDAQKRR